MCIIMIGSEGSNHVSIALLGRECPSAGDFWDGNWIRTEVQVVVGGFRGCVNILLRSEELKRFRDELRHVQNSLQGSVGFEPLECWLSLRVIPDWRGHVRFEGRIRDHLLQGNTLSFAFEYDQTYLTPILAQLNQALREYPVIGMP